MHISHKKIPLLGVVLVALLLQSCAFLFYPSSDVSTQRSYSSYRKYSDSDLKKALHTVPDATDKDFQNTEVPVGWQNESVVVLNQYTQYKFQNDFLSRKVQFTLRRRIKLQDQAAVDEFSELYLLEEMAASAMILKKNGRVDTVDFSKAISISEEVPQFYQFSFLDSMSYRKLAVPQLEVGDILDYTYAFGYHTPANQFYNTGTITHFFQSSYPIVEQSFNLLTDSSARVLSTSSNHAPKLSLLLSEQFSFDFQKAYRAYSEMEPKVERESWQAPYKELPYIKFQVMYDGKVKEEDIEKRYFLAKKGELKRKVEKDEYARVFGGLLGDWKEGLKATDYSQSAYPIHFKKRLKRQQDKLTYSYYYYRHLTHNLNAEVNPRALNSFRYAFIMNDIYRRSRIDHDVLVYLPRQQGKIEEVVSPFEVELAIRVKEGDKEVLLPLCDPLANYGDIPAEMEGVTAYCFKANSKSDEVTIESIDIPLSSSEDNKTLTKAKVKIMANLDSLEFNREITAIGHNRYQEWEDVISPTDYYEKDVERYGRKLSKKSELVSQAELQSYQEINVTNRLKGLKDTRSYDMEGEVNYKDFELIQTGRYHDKPELIYEETYSVEGLISRAGPHYVLHLGQLISQQVEISEREETRYTDIQLPFARSFENEIEIEIPAGYQVKGLKRLAFDVDNETGSFKSTARQSGNKIIVSTKKVYKKAYQPKENWPKMLEFLEAAYQFTQKKVVLKKM